MQATMRKEDILIRFGGDEFIIAFIPKIENTDEVDFVVNKLAQFASEIIVNSDAVIMIGASAGVALFPQDGKDIETLIASADTAMY